MPTAVMRTKCYNTTMVKRTQTDLAPLRSAYRKDLKSAVDRLQAQLARLPEVRLVVLFGSYAAGRQDLFSDLDLLVVMDSDLDFVTRSARLYQQMRPGVDLDLIVYTPQEFEQMRGRGFVRQALEEGRILYEKVATG